MAKSVNDPELIAVFNDLKTTLKKYEPPFTPRNVSKSTYHLWSEKDIEVAGRKRKEVYFAGLIIQTGYVGFYYMPVYAAPEIKKIFKPELLKLLKGKSCFHVKKLDKDLVKQIEFALKAGYDGYKKNKWI